MKRMFFAGLADGKEQIGMAVLDPIIPLGQPGEWDCAQTSNPCVVGDKLYYQGKDALGRFRIGLATSKDGFNWEKRGILLEPDDFSYPYRPGYAHPHVIRHDGGWKIWFSKDTREIWQASSKDGTRWGKPSLVLSSEDELWYPWVIDDDGLRMWLTRRTNKKISCIEHYDFKGDPRVVLEGSEKYEKRGVSNASVIRTDKYYMYYQTFDKECNMRIALAVSDDGLEWAKRGLVLKPFAPWCAQSVADPFIVDGTAL